MKLTVYTVFNGKCNVLAKPWEVTDLLLWKGGILEIAFDIVVEEDDVTRSIWRFRQLAKSTLRQS